MSQPNTKIALDEEDGGGFSGEGEAGDAVDLTIVSVQPHSEPPAESEPPHLVQEEPTNHWDHWGLND